MEIVCLMCGTIQRKSSNCRNKSCSHPFKSGGWCLKMSDELKGSLGFNESTEYPTQKNVTEQKCSNCGTLEESDAIYCSNCGEKHTNNEKQCPICFKVYFNEESYCKKDGSLLKRKKGNLSITENKSSAPSYQYTPSYKKDINIDKKTLEKNLSKIPFIGTLILYAIIMGYLKTNNGITTLGAIPGAVFGFVVTGTLAVFYYYFRKW